MAEPLWAGALHETLSCVLPDVSVGAEGLAGSSAGVAVAESDHELSPTPLVARTCTW